MSQAAPCPCGQPLSYDACCGALHRGDRPADTAEALMRSRYAAFYAGEVDYLVRTLHPSKRPALDREALAQSVRELRWVGLKILAVEAGQPGDTTGVVQFEASYASATELDVLHERSRFVKADGLWYYLDGTGSDPARRQVSLGLNAPCPCGSGKKSKRCCARKREG